MLAPISQFRKLRVCCSVQETSFLSLGKQSLGSTRLRISDREEGAGAAGVIDDMHHVIREMHSRMQKIGCGVHRVSGRLLPVTWINIRKSNYITLQRLDVDAFFIYPSYQTRIRISLSTNRVRSKRGVHGR